MEILTDGLSSQRNQSTLARKESEQRASFGDRPFLADFSPATALCTGDQPAPCLFSSP